jgi:hypothetical protein
VCRTWREIFTTRSSLWTDFCCVDAEKVRAYHERSKTSPTRLQTIGEHGLLPHDPLFQVDPHAVSRFQALAIHTTPRDLNAVTDHLSYPAPILETLLVDCSPIDTGFNPTLPPTLFRDLSSLRLVGYFHPITSEKHG